MEKTCTSEFFKDDRNCTSPKDEHNLTSLENSRVYVFFKLHEKPYYYLLIIYMREFRVNYIYSCVHSHRPSACVILSHTVNKLLIYFNSQRVYSVVIANGAKVRETFFKNLKSTEICAEFPFLAQNFFFWHCTS